MKIGVLRETKNPVDNRVPLTPQQCRSIENEFPDIEVFIQPSAFRCYSDVAYRKEGIAVQENLASCDVLLGIKELQPGELMAGKTYFFFSHTTKRQEHNRNLLKAILEKHIRMVDYEKLTDNQGIRIIGFGRWAGLVGAYQGLKALCIRHGITGMPLLRDCRGLEGLMKNAATVMNLPPIRVAITGDGRVAGGAEEMMNAFGIKKTTVEEYLGNANAESPTYVQLDPEKYNKRISGDNFDLRHFFNHPKEYESQFAQFCDKTDLLIMAAYWDPGAPVLYTARQMKDTSFRIKVVADITCDLNGSIPSTIRTTNFQNPYYDFNPHTGKEEEAFSNPSNITVMAIDNLPNGLPREASTDFGHNLIKNVISLLIHGDPEKIIERATIADNGHLMSNYRYLADWVSQQD